MLISRHFGIAFEHIDERALTATAKIEVGDF
jgi:hypothetical protein